MSRSSFAAVLVLAMSACKPDLPHTEPEPVAFAVFDPTTSEIPLPNDLAFGVDPNTSCVPAAAPGAPACAQAELLTAFGGKFPSDQEVAINIDFVQNSYDASGVAIPGAPNLDLTSFTASTFAVVGTTAGGSGPAPIDPLVYTKAPDGSKGTLTIHHQGRTPWPTGQYAVFIRGGDKGIKTTDNVPVGPSQVFDLIAQGQDMEDPKNIGLLKAQFGTTEKALEQGAALNQVINLYKAGLYPVVDQVFPHQELAIATTFGIDVLQTNVTIDSARGLVPLPIDLLRDSTGKISQLAACSLAKSSVAADGMSCVDPVKNGLANGFKTLDGFSTTGAILAPTSDLVQAATVTAATLKLYDLSNATAPVQVDPNTLIIEPCEFTSAAKAAGGCNAGASLAPVIAFQPSGATASPASPVVGQLPSIYRTTPLKDNTDYAVVMTTGILDKAGNPLASGTVAKILKFQNALNVDGKSGLSGIDDATTASLEKMRLQLIPVFSTLATGGIDKNKVAIAYTFHTQTVIKPALQLAALPYTQAAPTGLPTAFAVAGSSDVGAPKSIADAYAKYGATGLPNSNIDEVLEADITTFNLLDPASGAFNPDPTKAVAETIHVLITTPKATNANVPACAGGLAGFGKCAPMMIFRHGLTRGRADMLALANTNAAAGLVTVAIDAAKHGDRSFCTAGTTGTTKVGPTYLGGCNTGVACTAIPGTEGQGDTAPPGTCADGKLAKVGVAGGDRTADQDGIAKISGNYLISANFFRTRDTMRQDLIDESQLTRAIAFVPSGAPPTGHSVFDHMVGRGLIINPSAIYYTGQSLGAIQGTANVATNPRISKAVLNVGGGTVVDVFTNSPAFSAGVNALLAGLGIDKATDPAGYLQFLVVAKTILDPADPINFAGRLLMNTLPNLLANPDGSVAQAPKKILTQIADCDNTVPNPFNQLLASNVGTSPLPYTPTFFGGTLNGTFQLFVADNSITTLPQFLTQDCTTSTAAVSHGFLLDFSFNASLTAKAQSSAASFVTTDANQPSVEQP